MAVWSDVRLDNLSEDFRLDAEHYQPEYLRQEEAMTKLDHVTLGSVANISDGNYLSIAEEFVESGIRYLRGQDLSDFFISDVDPIYIPERNYNALARSHMFAGDVLVGIVGTIGSVGLVTPRHGKLTGNCKLAIVRTHSMPAEYIAIYLASRIGQNEIQRRIRGAVQMGLILPDLRTLPIVKPPAPQRDAIVKWVKEAERKREQSREYADEAEALLTNELGLGHVDLSESLYYEVHFNDFLSGNRFGAEYFMPCKQRVISALAARPSEPLGKLYHSVRNLFEPASSRRGEMVRNFDLTDALDPVLDDRKELVPATEVGSTKKRVRYGDVVISRLRSYLKEIALVRVQESGLALGSSEFIVLRKDQGKALWFTPETLMVFLRSLPVQTVLKWSQDGSQHPRFTDTELLAIPVPDALATIGPRIDALIEKSLSARADSSRLLDNAKTGVERLVLQSAK